MMQYSLIGNQSHAAVALAATRIGRIPATFVENTIDQVDSLAPHEKFASLILLDEEGKPIAAGVRAVFRCLAALAPLAQLNGRCAFEEGEVDAWVEVALNDLAFGHASDYRASQQTAKAIAAHLGELLSTTTYLVGQHITLADIVMAIAFKDYENNGINLNLPVDASRWLDTILHHAAVSHVLSTHNLAPATAVTTTAAADGASESKLSCDNAANPALARLAELGIHHTTIDHEPAFTVEQQAAAIGHLPGTLTKNLFLRDKKHGLFLVVAKHDQATDMKKLGELLKLGKSNLRLGDEDLLKEKLGVIRGAVSAFAVMNDTANDVKIAIDSEVLNSELINLHPLRNDKTTTVSSEGLQKFLQAVGHEPLVLEFTGSAAATTTTSHAAKEVAAPAASTTKASSGTAQAKPGKKSKGNAKEKTKVAASTEVISAQVDGKGKRETLLAVTVKKDEDFSEWYRQVITLSEMIDYGDISGCYVLRPWSFEIWEAIQTWFDARIKQLGVHNTYFPLFITKAALEAEKDHVEGFAPEVAWVTKSGESDLPEPIAVRPTSETIMYPFFAKWIRSHRDLPLKINQWCNVVRWEFKYPTPFLRSREFLWQEGHTAHITYEESQVMVLEILELYKQVYEDLLAVPVIKGMKTESEKFAGGYHTTTVEAYINGSGRAIQGATSHNLGQNFGKIFDITFEDEAGQKAMPWQTSWGLTTRTLGVMVMIHGDDKGLVLPPRVAPVQAVVIPIANKSVKWEELRAYATEIAEQLRASGVRVDTDFRQNYTAGWKFNHWEQKGVPVRVEVGPRDMANRQVRIARRDNGDKTDLPFEGLGAHVAGLMDTIHNDMFTRSKADRDAKIVVVREWKDFVPALNNHCLCMTPFCDEAEWEDRVKAMSREEAGGEEDARTSTSVAAKTLCKPFDAPPLEPGTLCFVSGLPATTWVLWGRSY